MGCGASTANGGAAPAGAPAAAAPAAAPAAGSAPAAAAGQNKTPAPWTTGTGIQFWSVSSSHTNPIAISGDVNCSKADLKKVVVLFDPRHLGFNKDFVSAVRKTLFKHKERTHGAEDWNAVDTAAGYNAGLKIRTLLITASPASKPEYCTAIEAGMMGMAFINTLCGSGWKGAPTMLKLACADDFYADPDGVLYKLYGQYDAAGNGGKSSAWKAYCSAGKQEVDAIKALKAKFDKDIKPNGAYMYLAENAGLADGEAESALGDLVNFIDGCIKGDANVATAKSTTRQLKFELPAENLLALVKNVTWPSNRRPVAFCMSATSHEKWSKRFGKFERPCFDVSAEIPDGEAADAADVAKAMIETKVVNKVEGHHKRKPIVIVGVDDLDMARACRYMCLMQAMQDNEEITGVTVIVHASAYENFASNKCTGAVLTRSLMYSTATVCCMTDELERVVEMFLAPSNESIVDTLAACMIPFPHLGLFTTHNALGKEIAEGGIMTTEFMVGNPGTGKTGEHLKKIFDRQLPLEKFACMKTRNHVLSDMKGIKKVHRLRMATKYDYTLKPISLIIPTRVLSTFLNEICEAGPEAVMDCDAEKVTSALTDFGNTIVRIAEGGSLEG